jgi:uncharacterized protein (DUF427 family)
MATRLARFESGLSDLRYIPTAKHVRATIDGATVVDSHRAVLLWEPRRVVPQYAVPAADVVADLVPGDPGDGDTRGGPVRMGEGAVEVLTPEAGFGHHTARGQVLTVRTPHHERVGAAFRLADPDLADHVVLDWDAFDEWFEEAQRVIGHPHDPLARIDVLRSDRHVRVERDGTVLAESSRPSLLFETGLPVRFYLPPEDVRFDLLRPSDTRTTCAYKGVASYWAVPATGTAGVPTDVAWTYPDPAPDAVPVTDMVCFFDERVDIVVDGERRDRPLTPWS